MAVQKKNGLIALKLFIKKLQNHLHLSTRVDIIREFEWEEQAAAKETVPHDVKEGHFTILAVKNENEKPTRFVVELCVLKHPSFLKLLKLAEEEYGFEQKGALILPCQPEELRKILQEKI